MNVQFSSNFSDFIFALDSTGLTQQFHRSVDFEAVVLIDDVKTVNRGVVLCVLDVYFGSVIEAGLKCFADVKIKGLFGLDGVVDSSHHEIDDPFQPLHTHLLTDLRVIHAWLETGNRFVEVLSMSEHFGDHFHLGLQRKDFDRQRKVSEAFCERKFAESFRNDVFQNTLLGVDDFLVGKDHVTFGVPRVELVHRRGLGER